MLEACNTVQQFTMYRICAWAFIRGVKIRRLSFLYSSKCHHQNTFCAFSGSLYGCKVKWNLICHIFSTSHMINSQSNQDILQLWPSICSKYSAAFQKLFRYWFPVILFWYRKLTSLQIQKSWVSSVWNCQQCSWNKKTAFGGLLYSSTFSKESPKCFIWVTYILVPSFTVHRAIDSSKLVQRNSSATFNGQEISKIVTVTQIIASLENRIHDLLPFILIPSM